MLSLTGHALSYVTVTSATSKSKEKMRGKQEESERTGGGRTGTKGRELHGGRGSLGCRVLPTTLAEGALGDTDTRKGT